jgi:hypothetical protein
VRSSAYKQWKGERAQRLDEIEASHAAVGGTGPGRRFATLQINQSYAVMLTSQFQGFCRDLHDECVVHFVHFVASLSPAKLETTITDLLKQGRKLDAGNPNPGNLGSDFGRFGIDFWSEVQGRDARGRIWQQRLGMLTDWRNAIAHQDFAPAKLHGIDTLALHHVRQWRNACNGLARIFDTVMHDYLGDLTGTAPW